MVQLFIAVFELSKRAGIVARPKRLGVRMASLVRPTII